MPKNCLVLFATCFVEGNTKGSCNTKFVHYLSNVEEAIRLDWCGYILECLHEARKSCFGKKNDFHGSVTVLILHYMDSKYASVGAPKKGLGWTTYELMTEDENLNKSKKDMNEKGVEVENHLNKSEEELNEEGVQEEEKLKSIEKGIANSLNLRYAKFLSIKQELEEELELCSKQFPENETYLEIKKKMHYYRDSESSRKASMEEIVCRLTRVQDVLAKNIEDLRI